MQVHTSDYQRTVRRTELLQMQRQVRNRLHDLRRVKQIVWSWTNPREGLHPLPVDELLQNLVRPCSLHLDVLLLARSGPGGHLIMRVISYELAALCIAGLWMW